MTNQSILNHLGVVGWDTLEAPIVASLASEATLLLIGPHGTAKSMVLENIARALNLAFRHYNASTLNFDDLIGFPAPDENRVKYLRTPLDAWDAEAVFLDEISRCRPDMQNRLFPLIHERKLQGAHLPKLRFCWAAMNPPPSEDDPNQYYGAQRLDAAFADRFSWVLPVPETLSMNLRLKLIKGAQLKADSGTLLAQKIAATKSRLQITEQIYGENVALFVDALFSTLGRSGIHLSFRRLRILYQNMLSLLATNHYENLADALFYGTIYSIPDRADQRLEEEVLIRAFQSSLKIQALPIDDLRRRLLEERDPIQRIAVALPSRDDDLLTATILDAYATLQSGERLALSSRLFPLLIEFFPEISALVLEQLAGDVGQIASLERQETHVYTNSNTYKKSQEIAKLCSQVTSKEVWIEDVLWTAFQRESEDDPSALFQFCRKVDQILNMVDWRNRVRA